MIRHSAFWFYGIFVTERSGGDRGRSFAELCDYPSYRFIKLGLESFK